MYCVKENIAVPDNLLYLCKQCEFYLALMQNSEYYLHCDKCGLSMSFKKAVHANLKYEIDYNNDAYRYLCPDCHSYLNTAKHVMNKEGLVDLMHHVQAELKEFKHKRLLYYLRNLRHFKLGNTHGMKYQINKRKAQIFAYKLTLEQL